MPALEPTHVRWSELVPLDVAEWRASKLTLLGAVVLTARRGPVTLIARKQDGRYHVTKMRGGRILCSRSAEHPPPRLRTAFANARRV